MKKIVLLLAAAALVCASAMGQDPEPKKKGGFWSKVKKGVESTTGLDVSDEALFVYPNTGVWKMKLISAIGNPEDNTVVVKFGIMPVTSKDTWIYAELQGVVGADGKELPEGTNWKGVWKYQQTPEQLDQCPMYQKGLLPGVYSEFIFPMICVPQGMKSFKSLNFALIGFDSNVKGFEIHSVPIEWKQAQTEN